MAPDLPEDFGIEPTVSQTLLAAAISGFGRSGLSPRSTNPERHDIAADSYYANEYQHQNPVYFGAGVSNYVYVKVRNRVCASSAGTENAGVLGRMRARVYRGPVLGTKLTA